ncbi:MAG: dihydroorotate dehydrogenase electron transfer subunit [candidate division WOR-3 bacterium]
MLAEVTSISRLTGDIVSVWLKPEALPVKPRPGQFYGIKIPDRPDLLLRRPFSIADVRNRQLRFVFRIVGKGTAILAKSKAGDRWDIIGPLGKPPPLFRNRNLLLCAGGVGIAPLLYLGRILSRSNRITLVAGTRGAEELILIEDFRQLKVRVYITTEDGSRGTKGRVTDLVPRLLGQLSRPVIYACGPAPMLAKLQELAGTIPVWGFLEQRMGCGTGICYCCGIEKIEGGYLRLCKEGPVVPLNRVKL